MGPLLCGAMSLVANENDRITHILVNEPYDVCRQLFYPVQPDQPAFYASVKDLADDLEAFGKERKENNPTHELALNHGQGFIEKEDITKALSELRKELRNAKLDPFIHFLAPLRKRIDFQISKPKSP